MKSEKQYNALQNQLDATRDNLSTLEHELYKSQRRQAKAHKATDTQQVKSQENHLTRIYESYYFNMALNIITYINTPKSLDTEYMEYLLRTTGFATVAGTQANDLHVLPGTQANASLGLFGYTATDTQEIESEGVKYQHLTRRNFEIMQESQAPVFVTLTNKFTHLVGGNSAFNDIDIIKTYAQEMARLRVTQLINSDGMRRATAIFTTFQNLDSEILKDTLGQGSPFIQLDKQALGSVEDLLQSFDLSVSDNLDSLRRQQSAIEADLLTQLGVNSLTNAKAERMNISETNIKDQLLNATGRVYTNARKNLILLSEYFGSDINYYIENADDDMSQSESQQSSNNVDSDSYSPRQTTKENGGI